MKPVTAGTAGPLTHTRLANGHGKEIFRPRMKTCKIMARVAAALYLISGILIIGSILNGASGLFINLIVGIMFISAGAYLYARAENIIRLVGGLKPERADQADRVFKRFLFFEYIFIGAGNLISMVFLYGVLHRVFAEKMPVFG